MKKIQFLAVGLLLPFISFSQVKTIGAFAIRVKIENTGKNARLYLAYRVEGKKY